MSQVPGSLVPPSKKKPTAPVIRNAADAAEYEAEQAAKAAAKKAKAALTPAQKRAEKLRREQQREEAEKRKKLKEQIVAERKAARQAVSSTSASPRGSGGASGEGTSRAESAGATGRGESAGGEIEAGEDDEGVDLVEQPDGTYVAVKRVTARQEEMQAEDKDLEEAEAIVVEEQKKNQEDYDIVFDEPKSPLILATAAKQYMEMKRLIQEVPIEYRVEFVNEYDGHGCSAIFFAISPEHQDCMQLLLDYGADPNHQNNKKNGPLHIACAYQNKKAMRILIEHGAYIMLENWQYQKPHEMVTERDKVSSTQAFLNTTLETYQEKVENKEMFGSVPRPCRSYFRSIYDITDQKDLGVLRYDQIEPHIFVTNHENVTYKPDPKYLFGFFSQWDYDKNGVISFPEFLHKNLIAIHEKEKIKKKQRRKQLAIQKRKKKKEQAAAKLLADKAQKEAEAQAAITARQMVQEAKGK